MTRDGVLWVVSAIVMISLYQESQATVAGVVRIYSRLWNWKKLWYELLLL